MPRFIQKTDLKALEQVLVEILDKMTEDGDAHSDAYKSVYAAYNHFEEGSNSAEVIDSLVLVVGPVNAAAAGMLASLTWTGIRQTNYPSAWNAAATNARDLYRTNHAVQAGVKWQCPGANFKPAHSANWGDITIDHRVPVADHWNSIGYNTTRQARSTWSLDTSNHDYLCQSCNSSKGSGNILYRITRGPQYSN